MSMEASVKREFAQARRNGKPVRTGDINDERQEKIERLRERKEDAAARRLKASVVGPIEQQLSDVKRERDYYKGLIFENKQVAEAMKQAEKLKETYENTIARLTKQVDIMKSSNDVKQWDVIKYRLKEAQMELKHKDVLIQKLIDARDEARSQMEEIRSKKFVSILSGLT